MSLIIESYQKIALVSCLLLTVLSTLQAGGDPKSPPDSCEPYYIWYQTGPDSYSHPNDFVDLYSITFDIRDIVDDFDFVYFTGSRAKLDANKDGVSDQHFSRVNENQLEWTPKNGRVRITERGCWSSVFNENCGYAMINIQPKNWYKNGSARIPIYVNKKCSPTGVDCSERLVAFHEYRNCEVTSEALPEFIIRMEVKEGADPDSGLYIIEYGVTIENTTDGPKGTTLTNTISGGTNGGQFFLNHLNVECAKNASCFVNSVTNDKFQIELTDVPSHHKVVVSYSIGVVNSEIPSTEMSYFTGKATLSTGGSAQVSVKVSGSGTGRPERPR